MTKVLSITESAKNHLMNILNKNNETYIMFGLQGGGCAGFEYFWKLGSEEPIKDLDEIIELSDGKVFVVDSHSLMYILGSTIDYQESLTGSMLVVDNPQAKSSCGCGVSVNI